MVDLKTLQAGGLVLSPNGASRYVGKKDQTYFGYIAEDGNAIAAQYDHIHRNLTTATLGNVLGSGDDHAVPAVIVLDDGNIMFFYGGDYSVQIYSRTTTTPEDVTTLGPPVLVTTGRTLPVFPHPHYNGAGIIVLFFRYLGYIVGQGPQYPDTQHIWWCKVSKDNGATWGAEFEVYEYVDGSFQVYIQGSPRYDCNEPTISDLTLCGHTMAAAHDHTVYYAGRLEMTDADHIYIKSPTGTILMDLNAPSTTIKPSQLTKIYDWTINGEKGWVYDIHSTSSTYIYCLYVTTNNDWFDQKICYARFNPTTNQFDIKSVIGEIHNNPEGGADPNSYILTADGCILYGTADDIVIPVATTDVLLGWQLVEYLSTDGGTTWNSTPITESPPVTNIMPVAVYNPHPKMRFLWNNILSWVFYSDWVSNVMIVDDAPPIPPAAETEEITVTFSANQNLTIPIGWNA